MYFNLFECLSILFWYVRLFIEILFRFLDKNVEKKIR